MMDRHMLDRKCQTDRPRSTAVLSLLPLLALTTRTGI
jgi:hypothetical protein